MLGAVWFIYDFLVNIGRGFSLQVFYNAPIGFLKGHVVWISESDKISVVSMISVISMIYVISMISAINMIYVVSMISFPTITITQCYAHTYM